MEIEKRRFCIILWFRYESDAKNYRIDNQFKKRYFLVDGVQENLRKRDPVYRFYRVLQPKPIENGKRKSQIRLNDRKVYLLN